VAIDDYLTPSVRILHDFLLGEDEWELIQSFLSLWRRHWGTSFFRRKREPPVREEYWHMCQNMNKARRHPLHFLMRHFPRRNWDPAPDRTVSPRLTSPRAVYLGS
jgi:hypothetical protein